MLQTKIVVIVIALLLIGLIFIPIVNNYQLRRMPFEQQVRIIKKQAKGLVYFKNVSNGNKGYLVYVKNKRKMLCYPWVLVDGKMVCTRKDPFNHWDHPDEKPPLTADEVAQAKEELRKYNEKQHIKLVLQSEK